MSFISKIFHDIGESTGINDLVDGAWNGAQDIVTGAFDAIGVKSFFDDLIPKYDQPEVDYSKVTTSRSPTYNSKIRANTARLGEAIPEVFGRVKMYPDLVSKSAEWYVGAHRKSNHLLSLGRSDSANPLVINAIELAGSPLTEMGATYTAHNGVFTQGLSAVGGSLNIDDMAPAKLVEISGVVGVEAVKDADNDGVYGFYTFAPIVSANAVYINVLFTGGLYDVDSTSGDRIAGSCAFSWVLEINGAQTTGTHTFTNSAPNLTEYFGQIVINAAISNGDDVRLKITRITTNKTKGGVNRCQFGQIFVYDQVDAGKDDILLIALQTKAKAELSKDTEQKVMVDLSRTGIATTRQAVEYVWQAAGLDMSMLDASPLDAATYTAINGIFDVRQSTFDTIKKIARLSRATPIWENHGVMTFYVDKPRSSVMTIDDSLLVVDSLKVDFSHRQEFENDGIRVRYHDPDTFVERFALYPSTAVNPRQEELTGCIDAAQAEDEARFLYLNMLYRNKDFIFKTELDANALNVGEVVHLFSQELSVDELVIITSISPQDAFTLSIGASIYDAQVYA